MSRRSFELVTRVPGTPEAALDFLADLDAHRGLHPYLESARLVGRARETRTSWTEPETSGTRSRAHWRVVERPRLGPFRYRIRFTARMTRESPTVLVGDVAAAPGCTLTTTTTASWVEGAPEALAATELHEVCVVVAPRPVVEYMTRHARLAHERTYALLPAELARRGEG